MRLVCLLAAMAGVGRQKVQEAQGLNRKTGKGGKMVKTWETSETRKTHSCKFVSLRG